MLLPELSEIGKLRKKFGITQSELARISGISQSLIARVESNTVDPRYSKIARIFRALEMVKGRGITASEIMSPDVVSIQLKESMEKAAERMKRHNVSQMPVFDRKRAVGSISEEIILDQIARGVDIHALSKKRVEEFMVDSFPVVSVNTPLATISVLLEYNKAVLVVKRGDIKGIITNADLLKVIHS